MRFVTLHPSQKQKPIGKVLCLGRNYADHAREMNSPVPEVPIVFLKPATAVIAGGGAIVIPPFSKDVHHEVEMVVLIGRDGKDIPRSSAFDYVAGYGVGLDMTLRDVQADAKKKGLPWSVAKGFDTSAPVSTIVEKMFVEDPHELDISLKVNGTICQKSNTRNMIFHVDHVVSYLSSIFTLEEGDLVFMGTPEGVGPVRVGDVLEAELSGVSSLRVLVQSGEATSSSAF
jgi:2-keto-4-pentenoate hydratase/2-oxohepta-3-ene-1,7-dioic acid hydratase in catechol pathway